MFPTYNEAFNQKSIPYDQLNHIKAAEKKERIVRLFVIFAISLLFILVISILLDIVLYELLIIFGLGSFMISVIISYIFPTKSTKKYKALFKRTVIGPLATNIINNAQIAHTGKRHAQTISYSYDKKLESKWLKDSQLFNTEYDDYKGEDLFKGQLGLTEFMFSEVHLTNTETTTDSDGNSSTTTVTVFDGLLFVADFKKDFKGFTVLETRSLKGARGPMKLIGNIITSLKSTTSLINANKIELENETFNRTFRIRTNDDIEARYILSPTMMEKLLKFVNSHKLGVAISFSKSYMYIAISSPRNFFDAGIVKVKGQYNVEAVYNELVFLFSIIENFELNNRIWSKQ